MISSVFKSARWLLAGVLLAGALRGAPAPEGGAQPLALILEDSSTIPAVEFERAKTQLLLLTTRLPEKYRAGLYAGGQPSLLIADFGADRTSLRDQLAALTRHGDGAGGLGTLQMAWGHGRALLPDAGGVIVLASDGRGLNADQLAGMAEQLAQSRWRVHVLGIGYPDSAALTQLAESTGGRYAPLSPASLDELVAALQPGAGAPGVSPAPAHPAALQPEAPGVKVWMIVAGATLLGFLLLLAFLLLRPRGGAKPAARPRRAVVSADDDDDDDGEPATQVVKADDTGSHPLCALLGKAGPKRGMTISIDADKGLTMGRSRKCDLIIADGTLSAQHLKITMRRRRYFVNDLQSTNGTFVNNQRVESSELRPGDLLRLGNSEFLVKPQGADKSSPTHG
jgi:hypothetical protein